VHIWVDADACPRVCKEILYRAAQRREIATTLVANQPLTVPPSAFISAVQVASGFDVADNHIVHAVQPGDLVVTADIPLAAELIEEGAAVITPRGERYTSNNIGARLNMRDFMEEMRASGAATGGPAPLSHADRTQFANALDRFLSSALG
jgi:uncharacterized protein YaiI (UPF0178 family)